MLTANDTSNKNIIIIIIRPMLPPENYVIELQFFY